MHGFPRVHPDPLPTAFVPPATTSLSPWNLTPTPLLGGDSGRSQSRRPAPWPLSSPHGHCHHPVSPGTLAGPHARVVDSPDPETRLTPAFSSPSIHEAPLDHYRHFLNYLNSNLSEFSVHTNSFLGGCTLPGACAEIRGRWPPDATRLVSFSFSLIHPPQGRRGHTSDQQHSLNSRQPTQITEALALRGPQTRRDKETKEPRPTGAQSRQDPVKAAISEVTGTWS